MIIHTFGTISGPMLCALCNGVEMLLLEFTMATSGTCNALTPILVCVGNTCCSTAVLTGAKGLNIAPNIVQIKTIPDITRRDPCHPYFEIRTSISGAKMNVPKPDPQTAMPVASDRSLSKYIVTLTIAGKYMRPKPNPVPTPIVINNVKTFFANTLSIRQHPASKAPAIVTARHPYRFTNDDEIGPN